MHKQPPSIVHSRHPPVTSVLVVEDEGFVRKAARQILQAAGYRVCTARTAREAVRRFRRRGRSFELLLTDVVLPGQSGQALAEELTTRSPGLKTIFISGYPENVVALGIAKPLPARYLAKPFSMESLTRTVREVLDHM
jgi:DNA-binding NtrC family response regulator